MTPQQVDRAKVLRDALKNWSLLTRGVRHKNPDRRRLDLQVSAAEPNYVFSVKIDPTTAKILLPIIRRIVAAELKSLGVHVAKRASR